MKKTIYAFVFVLLLISCDNTNISFPFHTVYEGRQNMIVYRVEKVSNPDGDISISGKYKYAVTDASGKGFTLYSFTKYDIGDTLHFTK